jgi:hypothetical protein
LSSQGAEYSDSLFRELLQKEGLAFGHILDEAAGVLRPKGADASAPAAPAASNGEIA